MSFAGRDELMRRFPDLTGLKVAQLRTEAVKPAFFVGLFDFLLANDGDLMDFAGSAGLAPGEAERARDELSQTKPRADITG
ncbi:hypothetical protein GCM10011390_20510 [Aureimonas endophytica]|uniref:DUF3572 family protein n=1 Tax=Aureimonas endophytica TaxID=2027858 RepID=A0A917E4V5_9HYPH|nr:DUF3572 family protein [Aureimonas endophytica]GGE01511.1 hypothetical protein GCM10011390_20510 [Aureimonas endophytica]